jgi:hypothetical protein
MLLFLAGALVGAFAVVSIDVFAEILILLREKREGNSGHDVA